MSVAVVSLATATVVAVKVAVVAPAATVTDAGTVTAALSLVTATTKPPVGAALLIVTVPVEEFPPTTVAGSIVTETTVGAVTLRFPLAETPLAVPVIDAVASVATGVVVAVNVADLAPAAMVTVAGTVTELDPLVRATLNPPTGALLLIATVPVELAPPATDAGLNVTAVTLGAVTVRSAVLVTPFAVAETVPVVSTPTGTPVTVKVAVVLPAETETVGLTVTAAELLLRATPMFPAGAALVSVTVAVAVDPPATLVGAIVKEATRGAVTVSGAVSCRPPAFAVIVAVLSAPTATEVRVQVPDVAPAGTLNTGTVTAVLLLTRTIVKPAAGAGPVKVAVAVAVEPPTTVEGSMVKVLILQARMPRVCERLRPVAETPIVVDVLVATLEV